MRKIWEIGAVVAITAVLLVSLEIGLRLFTGLGNPPIYIRDSSIDYMLKPSANYMRFGKNYKVNSFGMRADDPPSSDDKCTLRILIVGDSVANGGVQIDQSDIAGSIVQEQITKDLHRKAWVGTIATGGWSPESERAYLQKFGHFSADIIFFIFSSHDAWQWPSFQKDNGPSFPEAAPQLAIYELIERYILPRLLSSYNNSQYTESQFSANHGNTPDLSINAMHSILREAKHQTPFVFVIHNRELGEDSKARNYIQEISNSEGAEYIDLGLFTRNRKAVYLDKIHLSKIGHEILASVINSNIPDFKMPNDPDCRIIEKDDAPPLIGLSTSR